jgi:hypothetical protein
MWAILEYVSTLARSLLDQLDVHRVLKFEVLRVSPTQKFEYVELKILLMQISSENKSGGIFSVQKQSYEIRGPKGKGNYLPYKFRIGNREKKANFIVEQI